jgi:uncharacterized protein (UPF0297 family)
MKVELVCDYCAYHIGTLLDGIIDKRDIDETLKDIRNCIDENEFKTTARILINNVIDYLLKKDKTYV